MEKSNAGIEKIKMMVILLRDQSPENAVIYNAQWTHSLHSHYEQWGVYIGMGVYWSTCM